MSVWKTIVVAAVVSLLLFTGLIAYALYPSIRNVSEHPRLAPFTGRDLVLSRDVCLYRQDEGDYRFRPLLMSGDKKVPLEKRYRLPAGSTVRIERFKTFVAQGRTGITELYAIGTATIPTGQRVEFEYDWGDVNGGGLLKLAPWQDSLDQPVWFSMP